MSRLSMFLTAGLVLAAAPVAAAPITFNTALPVTQGEWILRTQIMEFRFESDSTGLDRDLSVEAVPLVGVYGLTPKLTLFAISPLLDKELVVNTPVGRRSRGDSGLGDVTLMARYTAWQRDAHGRTSRLAPFVGVEAPTGRDDAGDALGPLPPTLQLGSGSWDPLAGVVFTHQTLRAEVDASLRYQLNTEGNDFETGDQARLDLSYQHRVLPRELGDGVPAFLFAVLESNLIWQDRDEMGGVEVADSGGTTWFLAPGLQYVQKRWVLEAVVQLPAVQDLHGEALEIEWIGTLSLRVNL
ncbi:MAG: transporter [Thermoanaerobaculia bacterium]